jgi:type IX secretion system PorP/SprF family membrane protein
MKSRYIIAIFIAIACSLQAQQTPIYNSFFLNSSMFNPSVNGIGDEIKMFSFHKQYLTGFEGNPTTSFFSIGAPLQLNKMGVGLNIFNDRQGAMNRLNIQGSYAYRAQLGKAHNLDFGASFGMMQVSLDPSVLQLQNDGDPLLLNRNYSTNILDGNFGLTYQFKELKVEFAVNHLLGLKGDFANGVGYTPEQNFIGLASHRFFLGSGRKFSITPVILTRFQELEVPQQGALIFAYKDIVKIAPAYRNNGAISATLAIKLYDVLTVGYSFETQAQNNGTVHQKGAHEVVLAYSIMNKKAARQREDVKLKDLDETIKKQQTKQQERDALPDSIQDQQQKLLDKELKKTHREFEDLKKELKKSGALKQDKVSDYKSTISTDSLTYTTSSKGYYIVLASVKQRNFNSDTMEVEYLSKGYMEIYSETSGWHYVYKVATNDLPSALQKLKEARKNENPEAWILILE